MNADARIAETVAALSLPQAEARRAEVEEEIASIKAKLENVRAKRHAKGEWADPDWYRRATSRQRFLGVEHQQLNRHIKALRKGAAQAAAAAVERAFVDAARALLHPETFRAVMDQAQRVASA